MLSANLGTQTYSWSFDLLIIYTANMKKTYLLLIALVISNFGFSQNDEFPSGLTLGSKPYWNWHVYRDNSTSSPFNQSLLFAVIGGSPGETIKARLTQWGGLSLGGTTIAGTDLLSVGGNALITGNLDTKGNLYLNNISNQAGLRFLFDNTTANNGADVDLTVITNSGSPIVDWHIRNWYGSYVFNRGTNDGSGGTIKKQLFRIEGNGNIVVPQGNAIIDGKVNCEEVKVEVLDIPDYVFEPEYQLRTLKETKEFISENRHLPEIPSEEEILMNGGIDLGDMNMRLLKKIEELTLYQIELLERLEKQQDEIDELKKKID